MRGAKRGLKQGIAEAAFTRAALAHDANNGPVMNGLMEMLKQLLKDIFRQESKMRAQFLQCGV
ncbi:hypothetical protein SF123566_8054 [Shigella flexneri 1235-66]|nr:hypothetical protein SF123566_8054 [Shigella flexneri 1235-66]